MLTIVTTYMVFASESWDGVQKSGAVCRETSVDKVGHTFYHTINFSSENGLSVHHFNS